MIAVKGASLKTVARGDLEEGIMIIENNTIREISGSSKLEGNYEVIDAGGKVITPGFIDVHTHLGLMEEGTPMEDASLNEMTDPVTASLRVIDAINPYDKGFYDALKGGVTSVQVLPGSSNVIGGQGVVLKTSGKIIDEMIIKNPSGMKMALGENPKKTYKEQKKLPSTRMGNAACLRQALQNAKNYILKSRKEGAEFSEKDLALEALKEVLAKAMPVRIHAHRADDIVTAIRIAEEFGLEYTIEHCTEGDKIKEYLSGKGVKAAIGPTLSSRSKLELKDLGWHTVVELSKAGVKTSIITDHPVLPVQYLGLCAALAVREGLDPEKALRSITLTAAEHLGMQDSLGSLEPGKDADFVIWSGDPFHFNSQVEKVFIGGRQVVNTAKK